MTDKSVSRNIRSPLLGLLLVALVGAVATGAAADRVTNVAVKLDVNSRYRTCEDLFVGVEVCDGLGHLLASCHWDGRSDAFGTKACEKHFDRIIDSFRVYLTIRYKGEELAYKRAFIRVLPEQGIVVDFGGQVITITGGDSRQEFRPIRVTRVIDGQVVELVLRPGAKVGKAEVMRDSSSRGGEDWKEWIVDFLFWVDGSIVVHGKKGKYRIDLSARVERTALSPIAIIAGFVAPARSTRFADVVLHVPLS
jgi:hypothetical protein